MLTLNENHENILIGHILDKETDHEGVPVYWHPRKNENLLMDVDINDYLESKKFRVKYRLTKSQQTELIKHLHEDTVPENQGFRNVYYQVRHDVENSLYTELNLVGTKEVFRPLWYPYEKKKLGRAHDGGGKLWCWEIIYNDESLY